MFCSNCGAQNDDGSMFCENCGSPLEQVNGQANPNPAPQPAPQPTPNPAPNPMPNQMPNQNQQFYQQPMRQNSPAGDAFVSSFRALKDIFKSPATVAQNLAQPNGIISGMVYMGIKALIVLIIAIIAVSQIPGDAGMPKIILYVLIVTFGMNCLEAALIRAFSIAFKIDIDMKQAFTSVGVASWFSGLLWVVYGIFAYLAAELGLAIIMMTIPVPCIISFASICHISRADTNKKAYMYIIVRAIVLLVTFLATYILARSYLGNLVGGVGRFY